MIGERLGPYRIVELLGQGGLAEVYRAYHQETAADVALKILRHAPDGQARKRFAREAEALQGLDHPNIIRVLGAGEHDGRPYYTMPFVRVMNLQEWMSQRFQVDRGRFSQDEVLRILVDVARALRYSHGRGIHHRDVKPGNILVDANFRPTLCDFGLARLGGQETMTRQGTMLGTPRYMPPEQLQGRRTDARSDLYSLAMVGYELATGAIPFDGGEPLAAAVRRLTEPIPDLAPLAPHLDPGLRDLLMDCLSRDPGKRPANAGEVVRALEGLPGTPPPMAGAEEEEDATIEERRPSLEQQARQQPLPFVLGGMLALVMLVAFPLFLQLQDPGLVVAGQARLVPRDRTATLTFEADAPVALGVRYGLPDRLDGYLDSPAGQATRHEIRLEALRPDTEYAFALVLQGGAGKTHTEAPRRFRTAAVDP